MSHVRKPGICDCSCHGNPNERHVVPCCGTCPYCSTERIIASLLGRHKEKCPKNPKNDAGSASED